MLLLAIWVLFISSGGLCAPSDAVEVGVCNGDGCSALKSSIGAIEMARKELGCCTHADCIPSVTTVLCAHDVVTHFFQDASTSKVCSDFNEQCEALRVVKMNLQLSSNILGCHEREERAFISAPSASTSKILEDLLPQSVVTAIHNVLPTALQVEKVEHAVGTSNALATGVALAGGLSNFKGNVYFFATGTGQWGALCADGFTANDANTVCQQLGFSRAREFFGVTAGGGVRGNQFGAVPSPFRILSGITVTDASTSPPTTTGVGCVAPVAPLVPLQRCANFAAATNLGASPPPTCPSNRVAGVECAA